MRFNGLGVLKLSIAIALVALIWMLLLPSISDLQSVRSRIDGNRAAGVNPTAVFYTDHPGMADIERNIDSIVNAKLSSFWKPGD